MHTGQGFILHFVLKGIKGRLKSDERLFSVHPLSGPQKIFLAGKNSMHSSDSERASKGDSDKAGDGVRISFP